MGHHEDSGLRVTITDHGGGLITRWVTVAEVVEPDGERRVRIEASDELPNWDALGLLAFAAHEQTRSHDDH